MLDRSPVPFRIGATSFVYTGDLCLNAARLAPCVDDMELVLYEAEGYGHNYPDAATVRELRRIGNDHNLTYTVHLPMDVCCGNDSLDKAYRAIDSTRDLDPVAIILHFDGRPVVYGHATPDAIAAWQDDARQALAQVMAWVNDPSLICVENLERWDPRLFDPLIDGVGVSRCIDVGHLWLERQPALPYLQEFLPVTRVVHLHGKAERDHASLALMPLSEVVPVVAHLLERRYTGVVTLEVFGEADFASSYTHLIDAIRAIAETQPVAL